MSPVPKRLLFICTGNTCRSPLAQYFALRLAREAGLPWTASSAGTAATSGAPLSRGAADVLAERGIGPVAHRSRSVDSSLVEAADFVYVMESAHRDELIALFPEAKKKIFVLREAAGLNPLDVADPAGGDDKAYAACAASIEEALQIIFRREQHAPKPR